MRNESSLQKTNTLYIVRLYSLLTTLTLENLKLLIVLLQSGKNKRSLRPINSAYLTSIWRKLVTPRAQEFRYFPTHFVQLTLRGSHLLELHHYIAGRNSYAGVLDLKRLPSLKAYLLWSRLYLIATRIGKLWGLVNVNYLLMLSGSVYASSTFQKPRKHLFLINIRQIPCDTMYRCTEN